jgi:hypothetical protein
MDSAVYYVCGETTVQPVLRPGVIEDEDEKQHPELRDGCPARPALWEIYWQILIDRTAL